MSENVGNRWSFYAKPIVLSVEPYDVPEPAGHEVIVEMEAVPINPSDKKATGEKVLVNPSV